MNFRLSKTANAGYFQQFRQAIKHGDIVSMAPEQQEAAQELVKIGVFEAVPETSAKVARTTE